MQNRILFCTTIDRTLKSFLLPFAQDLFKQGWQVEAAAAGFANDSSLRDASFILLHSVPWNRNPWKLINFYQAVRRIRSIVVERKPNIVHVHTPVASFITRFALRNMRRRGFVKVVYTAHGFHFHPKGNFLSNIFFMALEKIAGRWTDRLVVINKEDAEAGLRYRIVPEKNLIHMPGIGVDINFYNREKNTENCKQQIRETLNINCRHKIILLAAEFIPRKQHKIALEGLSRMHRRDAILLFAGNGPLKAKIESLALSLGVSDRVRFMGFSSDIPQLMACSDIVLLASKREGLPRVLLEAMAMERPIVASNIRGCLELLEDECGYLFPEGNAQALANTLEEALDNPEEAARRAHQAHIKLKEKYSLGEVLAKHRRLYDELLGNL